MILKPLSQGGNQTSTTSSTRALKPLSSSMSPTVKKTVKTPTKKEQPTPIQQAQSNIIKLSKEPVIGKTLQLAKGIVDVGVNIAKQTVTDLASAFKAPVKDMFAYIKIQLNEKDRKELEKINKSKFSLDEKIKKGRTLLAKYGGQTEEEQKSAERGAEFGMTFTKPGGFMPEMGAVSGNLKYIFKQGVGKLKGEKQLVELVNKETKPQEVINKVFQSGLEKTPEGEGLIKTALQAEKKGVNVVIEKPIAKPKVEIQKPIAETETKIPTTEKIVEKTVSVPREQLPVASKEGIEKVSRLEARVTQSLEKTSQEIKDQLGSTYTQMNKKEQISKASRYVTEKPEEAMAVLRGEKEAPKDILKNSIYVAMENSASEDVELARRLASLASTREGQELSILTEIDKNSPVKIMRELVKIREEVFSRKFKGRTSKEVGDKVISDIKKRVKTPNKYDWNNFIEEIKC